VQIWAGNRSAVLRIPKILTCSPSPTSGAIMHLQHPTWDWMLDHVFLLILPRRGVPRHWKACKEFFRSPEGGPAFNGGGMPFGSYSSGVGLS